MTIAVTEHVAVRARAGEMGRPVPAGLVALPDNFAQAAPGDDLRYGGEATTVCKLLREAGLEASRLTDDPDRTLYVHNRSYDWALPAIFVATELLKQNPDVVSVLVDVVRDHVKELFGGLGGERKVSLEIVVEGGRGRCRKVSYQGSAEGLKEVTRMVRSLRS